MGPTSLLAHAPGREPRSAASSVVSVFPAGAMPRTEVAGGCPCESRSLVSGRAAHILRTRSIWLIVIRAGPGELPWARRSTFEAPSGGAAGEIGFPPGKCLRRFQPVGRAFREAPGILAEVQVVQLVEEVAV